MKDLFLKIGMMHLFKLTIEKKNSWILIETTLTLASSHRVWKSLKSLFIMSKLWNSLTNLDETFSWFSRIFNDDEMRHLFEFLNTFSNNWDLQAKVEKLPSESFDLPSRWEVHFN